jgi:hypothetical protein
MHISIKRVFFGTFYSLGILVSLIVQGATLKTTNFFKEFFIINPKFFVIDI